MTDHSFREYVDAFNGLDGLVVLKKNNEWLNNNHPMYEGHTTIEEGLVMAAFICMTKQNRIRIERATEYSPQNFILSVTKAQIENGINSLVDNYGYESLFDKDIIDDESLESNDICLLLYADIESSDLDSVFLRLTDNISERLEDPMPIFNMVRLYQQHREYSVGTSISDLFWTSMGSMWNVGQPAELCDFLDVIVGDNCGDIYNPFANDAPWRHYVDKDHTYYVATGDDFEQVYTILLNSTPSNFVLDKEHSFKSCDTHEAKTIVTTLPFGVILEANGVRQNLDEWLLENINDLMSEDGQFFGIIPANSLYKSGVLASIRKEIVDANILDSIVLLPSGIFIRSSMQTAILVLRKNREDDKPIRMLDLSYCCERDDDDPLRVTFDAESAIDVWNKSVDQRVALVSRKQITEQDYDWNPVRYTEDLQDIPHGYGKCHIYDLMHFVEYMDSYGFMKTYVVTREMLNDDVFSDVEFPSLELGIGQGVETEEEYIDKDFNYLSSGFLAVDYKDGIHTAWVPVIDSMIGGSAALEDCLIPYRVDTEVIDVDYLRLLLEQEYEAMQRTLQFEDNQSVDIEFKMRCREVVYPLSIEEQRKIYLDAKNKKLFDEALSKGLADEMEKHKQEYINEVRMRKHEMRQYLGDLANISLLLEMELDTLDSTSASSTEMRSLISSMKSSINNIDLLLERFSREETFGDPKHLNLDKEINDFYLSFLESNFTIDYDVDEMSFGYQSRNVIGMSIDDLITSAKEPYSPIDVFVDMAPEDLKSLCQNICENAKRHGFVDKTRRDYNITIDLSYDQNQGMALLQFTNNGKPLPKGLNAIRYGLLGEKAGATAHTGMGGYVVKRIVEHYKGKYDLFSRPLGNGKFQTVVRVWLPFSKK